MRVITVALVSRFQRIDQWIECVNKIDVPRDRLVIVVDGDELEIAGSKGYYLLDSLGWKEKSFFVTNNQPASPVNTTRRRMRIADNMAILQAAVESLEETSTPDDLIFGIEDDSYPPTDAFSKLSFILKAKSNAGIASGVQCGRHNLPYIGAWDFDNVNNPKVVKSLAYKDSGLENVNATGFYCYVTPKKLFIESEMIANDFGPDVNYGMQLSKKGYQAWVDWSVKVGHQLETNGRMMLPNEHCPVVEFEWNGEVFEQKPTSYKRV